MSNEFRTARPRWLTGPGALLLLVATVLSCNPTRPFRPVPLEDTRPAHISFLSNPDGASVRLNGTLLAGTTPLEYQEVPPGVSVVEFEKQGYLPVRNQHYWRPGTITRLDVSLEPLPTPTPSPTPAELRTRAAVASLAPAPGGTPPKTRAPAPTKSAPPAANAVLPAAAPKTTKVSFVSTPPGATVTVNGQALKGVAPFKNLVLPAGKAKIAFQLQNYADADVERNWKAGGEDTVAIDLVPLPARLSVHTTPAGAAVSINGVIIEGATPIENALVPSGESEIMVELENYVPHLERLKLPANGEASIEADLKPMNTAVRFESDPPGAMIVVNDKTLPVKAPAGPLPMPPGHARVEFQLEGHASRVVERDWAPNGVDSVLAKLSPNPGRVRFDSPSAWDTLAVDGKVVAVRPGGWLRIIAGEHRVLAQQGDRAAETEFTVPPGADTVVPLNWANKRPTTTDFVELPAIQTTLGDQRFADSNPVHTVAVPAVWFARREVTVNEYRACVEASRCPAPGTGDSCNWEAPDRGDHPINCVSAKDAEAYAAWFGEREGIPFRLPTTDEWERAARGSGDRVFPWGDDPFGARCNSCDRSCPIERFRDESFNDGRPETAPAGAMAYCASPEGIVDLVGNVAEWTRVGTGANAFQVRGGSWAQTGVFMEPALAVVRPATDRDATIGFRLVVSSDALPNNPLPTATPADTPTPQTSADLPAAEPGAENGAPEQAAPPTPASLPSSPAR